MREDARTKGLRYLTEGRLDVEHRSGREVRATCRGDSGEVYRVEHSAGAWSCSCAALGTCSHIQALMLVVVVVRSAAAT